VIELYLNYTVSECVSGEKKQTMHPPLTENGPDDRRKANLGRALCECAAEIEAGSMEKAARCLSRATGLADAMGDGPLPRLTAPVADCLARRLIRPLVPAVADALIDPSDHLDRRCVSAARRSFFELSPFHKAAVAVGNRVILEAMENEKVLGLCAASPSKLSIKIRDSVLIKHLVNYSKLGIIDNTV
jgi:hypothetical protein